MTTRAQRFLLAFSSLLMTMGGASHAAAFNRTLAAVTASNLPPFYGGSLKLLWLADSASMFILAALFGLIAALPTTATRPVVLLLALIPTATAVLVYTFLGNFFAGHILMVTAAAVFFAGLLFPGAKVQAGNSSIR